MSEEIGNSYTQIKATDYNPLSGHELNEMH